MITPCQVDSSLTTIRLTKCAIDFGGRRYITISNLGAMTAKLVKGVNHGIVGPSYLQVIYPLIVHFSACFNRSRRIQNGISIPNRTEVLTRANYHRSFHSICCARRTSGQERADPCKSLGLPDTLHSDQGPELKDVFGHKKTKSMPSRPKDNSVLERMHSTLHAMLLIYSNIAQNNWAEVLPFIQLAQKHVL